MSHGRSALCWSSALFATTLIVMSYLGWLPAQSLLYFLSSAERKENKMKNLVVRYFTGKLVYQGDSTPVTINGKLGLTWGSLFLIRNRTESKEKTTKLKTYFFYHTPVPIQAQLHPFLHHFSAPCCGLTQKVAQHHSHLLTATTSQRHGGENWWKKIRTHRLRQNYLLFKLFKRKMIIVTTIYGSI